MWIVFGWEKEQKPLGVVGTAYCYDCRRKGEWLVSRESEWVTFSDIRVFRFVYKHHMHCNGCSSNFLLAPAEFKQVDRHMRRGSTIDGSAIHVALTKRIETQQLSSKTPQQLKFIRESMQALEQYETAIEAQNAPNADHPPPQAAPSYEAQPRM